MGPWVGFHENRALLEGARVSRTVGVLVDGPRVYFRESFAIFVGLVGVMRGYYDTYGPGNRLWKWRTVDEWLKEPSRGATSVKSH